jgi:hypothetical protein
LLVLLRLQTCGADGVAKLSDVNFTSGIAPAGASAWVRQTLKLWPVRAHPDADPL